MTQPMHAELLTAHYHTFGCKLNFAETATVREMFLKRGITDAQEGAAPDIVVINTCSVTELADKKCRQTIRSMASRWPNASIVVTGCYAQLKPAEVSALPGVVVVAGNDRKLLLSDYLDSWLESRNPIREVTPSKDLSNFSPSCSRGSRTRYFLKVQDGCDYFCSYCTIPFARGRSRSGSVEQMVQQAHMVAQEGGKEIVLTGVNIGDFGRGKDADGNFFDLIRALDQVDGIERYRISSIEPNLLTDDIIRWVAQSRRFMPHFHIPLQAGNDQVLSLMRRRYDTVLFAHKIAMIRDLMPDAFIGVDLIAGARGETPELFEQSKLFVESIDISRLHVFPYSERPGTLALRIPHQVSQHDKHLRVKAMMDISDTKLASFAQRFVNTVRPVLVEHTDATGMPLGHTDNYIRVRLPKDSACPNTIVPVRLSNRFVIEGGDLTMEGEPAR